MTKEQNYRVLVGDCRELLRDLADASIDAIVTDPPYELGFMGKRWDASGIAYDVSVWNECLRVLKPGGHLLAFGGTRTYHRMACAIEDAGFEVRDSLHWIYGSGFPKSMDVSKAIDKAAGAEREVVRTRKLQGKARVLKGGNFNGQYDQEPTDTYAITAPATDAAKQWRGWGTALKPAHEPIVVARKPLVGTVAENVLKYGTGGLNIDGTRIATTDDLNGGAYSERGRSAPMPGDDREGRSLGMYERGRTAGTYAQPSGRWPANVVLTHSPDCRKRCAEDCPVAELDRQSGERPSTLTGCADPSTAHPIRAKKGKRRSSMFGNEEARGHVYADSGGASRFFASFRYAAKASRREREAGCEDLPAKSGSEAVLREEGSPGTMSPRAGAGRTSASVRNHHPTVKPVSLMRWLVRLVTPPQGLVLDPFSGSGTTGVACVHEGFRFVGFEQSDDYAAIAKARIRHAQR